MDTLFILAGVLGLGDILLLRIVARERTRRRKAERTANSALRDNYRLMDALERKAGTRAPVVAPMPAKPRAIREALSELQTRQAADTGGLA
jgi:hypothetical protein